MEIIKNYADVIVIILAVVYAVVKYISKAEIISSFNQTVTQLASENMEARFSAAILLRRYMGKKYLFFFDPPLKNEAINVVSSLLRTLPTGIYQKTLGDGLAYVINGDLSNKDFQRTNLQNLYIGNKDHRLKCVGTDCYMADLSYALLDKIDGNGIIFYNAILMATRIKHCDFSGANFMGADLTNTRFTNVILFKANFKDAVNVPKEIADGLDENGIYTKEEAVTTQNKQNAKTIFFSMPGVLSKDEEIVTKAYKDILEAHGYEVIYYERDNYPKYGQLNKVRASIKKSAGVIVFGFKQINIKNGLYRPNTREEKVYNDKWLSTPWSELEVGIAVACGLPILLVHDDEVSEGVFDEVLSEYFIGKVPFALDVRKINTNEVFNNWIKML